MAVQRWLILDADGMPQNVVLWGADENPDWEPPEGCAVIPDDGRMLVFEKPVLPVSTEDRLTAASDALAGLDGLGSKPSVDKLVSILAELRKALEQ